MEQFPGPWKLYLVLSLILPNIINSKIHHLRVQRDRRSSIELTHFGYALQGTLDVRISNFSAEYQDDQKVEGVPALAAISNGSIGFTFSKGDEVPEFVRTTPSDCLLDRRNEKYPGRQFYLPVVYFIFDLKTNTLKIERHGKDLIALEVCRTSDCKRSRARIAKENIKENSHGKVNMKRKRGVTPKTKNKKPKKEKASSAELKNMFGTEKPASDSKNTTSSFVKSVTLATKKPLGTGSIEAITRPVKTSSSRINFPATKPVFSTSATKMIGSAVSSKKPEEERTENGFPEMQPGLPTVSLPVEKNTEGLYDTQFGARIFSPQEEGNYYLIYHNCKNYDTDFDKRILISFTIDITEKNANSYLAAGDTLKPSLYFGISVLFFFTGIVWVSIVRATKSSDVYRIHHLMTALVFIKSISLMFHGVDFYFISVYGRQQEVWAVVFYIMHLLKGALLFGVIILIGTGYTFFKNFLTERDRKLFMIIIPLQVLDNVAMVIIEESEEGTQNYRFWMQLFIFIDLICCLAIILPVIWSIRHLQEASETDGKAAFNLEKLRLFRHFYILIICYVYLTRIIKYLVVFTVPFKFTWLVVVVEELGTWVFFVLTGYKFKPASNNPYFKLSQSDEELEMEEPLTQSGVLEGVTRLKRGPNSFDTSLGSPEGEELLGEDVVYSKETYDRTSAAVSNGANKLADDRPGPDIY